MGGRRFAYILVLLVVVLTAFINGKKSTSPGCRVVQLGKKFQCSRAGLSKIPKIPKGIMIADFTDNLITSITQEDWKRFEKLQKVYLKGNPFHCDCNLEWLRLKLDNSPAVIQDGDSIQCATPSKIHNKHLKSLSNLCEIKSHVETLNTRGIESGSYSLLSIDKKYNHLLVGAKGIAFLVDLENIQDFKSWNLTNPAASVCDRKQDGICHDFVKIMLPFNERIFLCWAGTPMAAGCAWRNRTDLSDAPGKDNQGNVFTADVEYSSSLDQNDTAIITEHGRIFIGTINPFSAKSIIHSKSFKRPKLHSVFTSWLDHSDFYTDVHFVKSFIIGHYVYFFFRERMLECSSCGKPKVSRVARICKGDYGGRYSHRNHFVTFQKAKLTCSDGEDFPGNFNEIQDVWWDEQTNLFHATFIAQPCRNGPPSSAICVYNLSDINHVFDKSSFKSFNNDAKQWVTVANNYKKYFHNCKVNPKKIDPSNTARVPEGMMATRKMTYSAYRELRHDPLMEDPVKPTSFNSHSKKVSRAWFIKDGIWMTAIALDKVGATTVVYASTDRGSVLKISKPAGANQPCLLTELDVFSSDKKEVITAMTIDITRHVLYLGSNTTLTKLRLERCSSNDRHSSCISAADPYCAWDKETRRCVSVLSHGDPSKLGQDLTTCPQFKEKDIEWSAWKTCVQSDGNLCRCQARPCQSKGNSSCEGGYEFRLKNCTVDVSEGWEGKEAWETFGAQHGNWSKWGTWSKCGVEPGAGVRHRKRACTSPVPRRGGRPCVGDSVQYKPCSLGPEDIDECKLKRDGITCLFKKFPRIIPRVGIIALCIAVPVALLSLCVFIAVMARRRKTKKLEHKGKIGDHTEDTHIVPVARSESAEGDKNAITPLK